MRPGRTVAHGCPQRLNGPTADRLANSASLRAAALVLLHASFAKIFAVRRRQDKRRGCQLGLATRGRSGPALCTLHRALHRAAPTGQTSRPGSARRQLRHQLTHRRRCMCGASLVRSSCESFLAPVLVRLLRQSLANLHLPSVQLPPLVVAWGPWMSARCCGCLPPATTIPCA